MMHRRRHSIALLRDGGFGRAGLAAAVLGLVIAEPALAGRLTDFSQEELLTLPRQCLAQRFINEELTTPAVPEAERTELAKALGHSYIHYHHYCWALLYIARASQPGGDKFNYHRAVDNFDYVIRNADPGFVLLLDVYVQKGNVLERTGQGAGAEAAYREAIRVDPSYAPAYVALSHHYVAAGDQAAARAIIAQGLARDPKAKPLLERQAALGK